MKKYKIRKKFYLGFFLIMFILCSYKKVDNGLSSPRSASSFLLKYQAEYDDLTGPRDEPRDAEAVRNPSSTENEGIFVAETTGEYRSNNRFARLLRFNFVNHLMWGVSMPGGNVYSWTQVAPQPNEESIFAAQQYQGNYIRFQKYQSDGNSLGAYWDYSSSYSTWLAGMCANATTWVVGDIDLNPPGIFLLKLNETGGFLLQKMWTIENGTFASGIIDDGNNGVFITGYVMQDEAKRMFLAHFDENGNLLQYIIPTATRDEVGVCIDFDGTYIFVGGIRAKETLDDWAFTLWTFETDLSLVQSIMVNSESIHDPAITGHVDGHIIRMERMDLKVSNTTNHETLIAYVTPGSQGATAFSRINFSSNQVEDEYVFDIPNVQDFNYRLARTSNGNIFSVGSKCVAYSDYPFLKLFQIKWSATAIIDPTMFISVWYTTSNQVHLPLVAEGTYNFTVDWGDESNNTIISWNQAETTHTYSAPGIYTVRITGVIIGWQFNETGDCLKIIEIQQWGCLQLGNAGSYFSGCTNLMLTATDQLNLTGTTNLAKMFRSCYNLGNRGNIKDWDVSKVMNMSGMFATVSAFNQPIGTWDVSKVTDMSHLFHGASSFNQPIGTWNVSNVTDMSYMFCASAFNQPLEDWDVSHVTDMNHMFALNGGFNQPIGDWNVSNVKDMSWMFWDAWHFNQPIETWDVSHVTDMSHMFVLASNFNRPIGTWNVSSVTDMNWMFCLTFAFNRSLENWDVSHVTDMSDMFGSTTSFNQPIGTWNVSSVLYMNSMFFDASAFNQPLETWDVSHVTDMGGMFTYAVAFNQSLANWDVSHVTDMNVMFSFTPVFNQPLGMWNVSHVINMGGMFFGAMAFNQPIDEWDVSHVIDMNRMFASSSVFNQPLGDWDVSHVTDMQWMFREALSFNQPLGTWNVSQVDDMSEMFAGVTLSTANYDHLLLGWSQLPLQPGITFDAGNSKYSPAATAARELIIDTYSWVISDGGEEWINTTTTTTTSISTSTTTSHLPVGFISGYSSGILTGILIIMALLFTYRRKEKITHDLTSIGS